MHPYIIKGFEEHRAPDSVLGPGDTSVSRTDEAPGLLAVEGDGETDDR